MTITTEQAIQMAREVGCLVQENNPANEYGITLYEFHAKTLTAFANAVRRKTLLEAAGYVAKTSEEVYGVALIEHIEVADELRRMAEEE